MDDQEAQELRQSVGELRAAVEALRTAQSPAERREARSDVDEAEAAFEQYARAMGISVSDAHDAIEKIKETRRKEELRGVVREIMDELLEAEDPSGPDPNADPADPQADPNDPPADELKVKREKKPVKKEDSPPSGGASGHWLDRKLL